MERDGVCSSQSRRNASRLLLLVLELVLVLELPLIITQMRVISDVEGRAMDVAKLDMREDAATRRRVVDAHLLVSHVSRMACISLRSDKMLLLLLWLSIDNSIIANWSQ